MSQSEKAEYYRQLKAAGVDFSKHYREYSTEELKAKSEELGLKPPAPSTPVNDGFGEELTAEERARFMQQRPPGMPPAVTAAPPVAPANPNEMPGQRLNLSVELEPIRTDEQGRVWFQEEVLKPSYPKPRGRRVLQYMDGGVEERTVQEGNFTETFEVAGTAQRRPAEVKITLPSYQVGIYKDPRFPFKVHTYNGNNGFDLFEVQNFFGGAELVPTEVKRVYVENVLCYDIRTTVRAIQFEYRQLQLAGKVK